MTVNIPEVKDSDKKSSDDTCTPDLKNNDTSNVSLNDDDSVLNDAGSKNDNPQSPPTSREKCKTTDLNRSACGYGSSNSEGSSCDGSRNKKKRLSSISKEPNNSNGESDNEDVCGDSTNVSNNDGECKKRVTRSLNRKQTEEELETRSLNRKQTEEELETSTDIAISKENKCLANKNNSSNDESDYEELPRSTRSKSRGRSETNSTNKCPREDEPKRKRGRPRKITSENGSVGSPQCRGSNNDSRSKSSAGAETKVKRGRGRPKKMKLLDTIEISEDEERNTKTKHGRRIKRKRNMSSDVECISSEESSEDSDAETKLRKRGRSSRSRVRNLTDNISDSRGPPPHNQISPHSKTSESPTKSPSPKITGDKDVFCWQCHREGNNMLVCHICPRVYHKRCAKISTEPETWICIECNFAMIAGSFHNRSEAKALPQDEMNQLLKFVMERIYSHDGAEYFKYPVDLNEYERYRDYVINPMDLSMVEKNINNSKYKTAESFLADLKWLLHNSYVFNTAYSELTAYARGILKIAKQETEEIENCPYCYFHYHTMDDDTWFIEPCKKPHLLVWAKLRGFPHWPAKVMRIVDDVVDVRFFGDHNRSWLPPDACYLFSKAPPFVSKTGNQQGYSDCIKEVFIHIKKLKDKFNEFCFAPARIKYEPAEHAQMLSEMLPLLNESTTHKSVTLDSSKMFKNDFANKKLKIQKNSFDLGVNLSYTQRKILNVNEKPVTSSYKHNSQSELNKVNGVKNIIKPKKPDSNAVVTIISSKPPSKINDNVSETFLGDWLLKSPVTPSFNDLVGSIVRKPAPDNVQNTPCEKSCEKIINQDSDKQYDEPVATDDNNEASINCKEPGNCTEEEQRDDNGAECNMIPSTVDDTVATPITVCNKMPQVILTRIPPSIISDKITEEVDPEKNDSYESKGDTVDGSNISCMSDKNEQNNLKTHEGLENADNCNDNEKLNKESEVDKSLHDDSVKPNEIPETSNRVMLKVKSSAELLTSEALKKFKTQSILNNTSDDGSNVSTPCENHMGEIIDLSYDEDEVTVLDSVDAVIDKVVKGDITVTLPSRELKHIPVKKSKQTVEIDKDINEISDDDIECIDESDNSDEMEIDETPVNTGLDNYLNASKNISDISAWSLEPCIENATIIESMNEIFQSIEESKDLVTCKNLMFKFRKLALLQRDEMKSMYQKVRNEAEEVCESFMAEKERLKIEKNEHSERKNNFAKQLKNIKLTQWCSSCLNEANFYCCWGTSYCSKECQLKDWDNHFEYCKQSEKDNDNLMIANPVNKNGDASTSNKISLPPSVTINKFGMIPRSPISMPVSQQHARNVPVIYSKQVNQPSLVSSSTVAFLRRSPVPKQATIRPKSVEGVKIKKKPIILQCANSSSGNVFKVSNANLVDGNVVVGNSDIRREASKVIIKRDQLKNIGESISKFKLPPTSVSLGSPSNSNKLNVTGNATKVDQVILLNKGTKGACVVNPTSSNSTRYVVLRSSNGSIWT